MPYTPATFLGLIAPRALYINLAEQSPFVPFRFNKFQKVKKKKKASGEIRREHLKLCRIFFGYLDFTTTCDVTLDKDKNYLLFRRQKRPHDMTVVA